jgi:hypothetical protein
MFFISVWSRQKIFIDQFYVCIEVEYILEEQRSKDCHGYKVKWRGYPLCDASWQSANSLGKCKDVLALWKKRQRLKSFKPEFDVNYQQMHIDQFGLRDVQKPETETSNCL